MTKQAKILLTVLFPIALVTANVTASKVAQFDLPLIGAVAVPAGFIAIGASFLFSDLLNERYGRDYARSVVNATVAGLVMAFGLIYVAIAMPSAPFYPLGGEFEAILGGSATIITASIITILVSQNLDVVIFDELKRRTGDGHKWVRNLGSTGTSQLVDTTLFIVLGFALLPPILGGEVTPWSAIPGLIFAQYVVKLIVAVLDTPLFYIGAAVLED